MIDEKIFSAFKGGAAKKILDYAKENYGAEPEFLWNTHDAVLRHSDNRKWFAALLTLRRDKLGLDGDELTEVLNLKCDHVMIGALIKQDGYFPAWHMSKEHWISIVLDGTVDTKEIIPLLDLSYNMTKQIAKRKKK